MDGDSTGPILILAAMIVMSAYFSATETAFSSLNRIRIKNMAEGGNKRAALVLKLYENYDTLLSTILVGNNIVNIASASIGTMLFVGLYGNIGATISTIVITVVVLIFGEISPKSLAKESPEKFAMFSAPIIRVLIAVLTPVNFLFSMWKKLLSKLFKTSDDASITEEELLTMVEEAESEGAIDEEDSVLIRSVMDFNDQEAIDILTPRVDIIGVEKDASMEEIAVIFAETAFSRIPVYEESIDRIIGLIHIRDFYNLADESNGIAQIIKPVVFAAPHTSISDLLGLLQLEKTHLAVITDEYGGTAGIVTMEDILEELVGEIWDEHDEVEEPIQKIGEAKYLILCSIDLDRFFSFFGIKDEEAGSSSVSGWILDQLDGIPDEGDSFDYESLHVKVEKTDANRVLEAIVSVTD